jgi:hypothetical protein
MEKDLYRIYVSYASHGDEFPFARTIHDVKFPILMEYGQRVIVRFLFNHGLDARQITEKLKAQLHEDAYSFRTVEFWIGEVQRG